MSTAHMSVPARSAGSRVDWVRVGGLLGSLALALIVWYLAFKYYPHQTWAFIGAVTAFGLAVGMWGSRR